ncbi:uncharacterized protein LOC142582834 isoform X2 [Dermacentor variabilis]|uniref:uncharacterized protein LOC142582834 isoform X2 n=1 Tax=Dermacentor variabilis TaxID=34621 RepID=UPI003F5C6C80
MMVQCLFGSVVDCRHGASKPWVEHTPFKNWSVPIAQGFCVVDDCSFSDPMPVPAVEALAASVEFDAELSSEDSELLLPLSPSVPADTGVVAWRKNLLFACSFGGDSSSPATDTKADPRM